MRPRGSSMWIGVAESGIGSAQCCSRNYRLQSRQPVIIISGRLIQVSDRRVRGAISMTQAPAGTMDYQGPESPGGVNAKRLFLACFASMFATSFAFIVRAMLITEWGQTFGLTEAQKGAIFPGAALFPFAISIVLFSLFIDNVGYGKTMAFALIGHVVGTVVTMLAATTTDSNTAYQYLYFGTFITALANGAVEAVIN